MFSVKKNICLTREYGAMQIIYFLKTDLLEKYLFLPYVGLNTGTIL